MAQRQLNLFCWDLLVLTYLLTTRAVDHPFYGVSPDISHHLPENFGMIILIRFTPRLQTPLYFFLTHLECVNIF